MFAQFYENFGFESGTGTGENDSLFDHIPYLSYKCKT
jgi:hypothetical protein